MSKQTKVTVKLIAPAEKDGLFNIQGDNNQDYVTWVGNKVVPKVGDTIILFPNENIEGQWKYWKVDRPQQSPTPSRSSNSNNSSNTMTKADWAIKDIVKDQSIIYSVGLNNLIPLAAAAIEKELPLYFSDEKNKKPVVASSLQEYVEWASELSHELAVARAEYNKSYGKDNTDD